MKVLLLLMALLGCTCSGKIITDQDIEELNRLIPDGQWQAGRVFHSTEEAVPLLGARLDTTLEHEKVYRPGFKESVMGYEGKVKV